MPSSEIEFTIAALRWMPPSETIFVAGVAAVGSTSLEMKATLVYPEE